MNVPFGPTPTREFVHEGLQSVITQTLCMFYIPIFCLSSHLTIIKQVYVGYDMVDGQNEEQKYRILI